MLRAVTTACLLTLALLCLACDEEDGRDLRSPASGDSASGSVRDSLSDTAGMSSREPPGRPQPFDSSYEHYIRTVPEEELDSIPMPKTPE